MHGGDYTKLPISDPNRESTDVSKPPVQEEGENVADSSSKIYEELELDALASDIETLLFSLEEAFKNKKPIIRIEEDLEKKLNKLKTAIVARNNILSTFEHNTSVDKPPYDGNFNKSYGELFLFQTGLTKQYEKFQKELTEIKKRQLMSVSNAQKKPLSTYPPINNENSTNLYSNSELSQIESSILRDQDSRLSELERIITMNKEAGSVMGQELDNHTKIIRDTSLIADRLQNSVNQGNEAVASLDNKDILSNISMCKLTIIIIIEIFAIYVVFRLL